MTKPETKNVKNEFGGTWTVEKLEILEKYAIAYLKVFKNKPYISLLYFDGFAGSGDISHEINGSEYTIEGSTRRILDIDDPRSFDLYYFVEKSKKLADSLQQMIREEYPTKKAHVANMDCNCKIIDLANFLKDRGKKYKVLAFIDPKGMQLEWNSIKHLKGLNVDLWILNPTSGCNRLLKNNGDIIDSWKTRLQKFLGMEENEIMDHFYKTPLQQNLFGHTELEKEKNAIQKLHLLYANRIKTIFKYVSDARVLRDSQGRILFHFFMATNNEIALRIANSTVNSKAQKI